MFVRPSAYEVSTGERLIYGLAVPSLNFRDSRNSIGVLNMVSEADSAPRTAPLAYAIVLK